jgi:hypothetical protein
MGAVLLDPFLEIGDGVAADAELDEMKRHIRFQSCARSGMHLLTTRLPDKTSGDAPQPIPPSSTR